MATTGEDYYDRDHSSTRPPLFKGTNFSYQKLLMQMFIKIEDYKLWNITKKGAHIWKTTINGKLVKKTKDQYTQVDFVKLLKICKAMHILYCGLNASEYNCIYTCEIAKQI